MRVVGIKFNITAKALAKTIGCKYTTCKSDCRACRASTDTHVIAYGTKCPYSKVNKELVPNKLTAHKIMKEAGIPQPEFWLKGASIPANAYPVLARKSFHSRGRDVIVINNAEDLSRLRSDQYDYLIKYMDKKSEFRAHVLGDECPIVNAKVPDESYQGERDMMIRNNGKGWHQMPYNGQHRAAIQALAIATVKALGYNFGAVDIMRTEGTDLRVLEVNSAPALSDWKLEQYAAFFQGKPLPLTLEAQSGTIN